jgi:ABC transport system ATP-binding/permease protein
VRGFVGVFFPVVTWVFAVNNELVLRCRNLTVRPPGDPAANPILDRVSAAFRPGAMNALIGPSGCGKTTLAKAMLGLVAVDPEGEVWLGGERVNRPEDLLGRVGFAPQFSIAQPKLTVEECLRYGLALSVEDAETRGRRLEHVLNVIGLTEHRHKRVESLSGGQLRRLGLGLELTVDPPTLFCDEVTSGLDPNSENLILDMLRVLSRERGKTLICIIHNLAKLNYFEWITVVNRGQVVFQGTLDALHAHFGIPDALHLYDALNSQPQEHWLARWAQARENVPDGGVTADPPAAGTDGVADGDILDDEPSGEPGPALARPPPGLSQFGTLLRRRLLLFWRDQGYLALVMAITFGFPVMVVIFALDGLPQISSPPLKPPDLSPETVMARLNYSIDAAHTASLVTSLIMFQVILLTLMGANNGAREIAAERLLYEKERLNGLRPGAYAAAKLVFTGVLAAFQGLWMTAFVKVICIFPGPWGMQMLSLALVCVAMTWVCLGFSAWLSSAEKASTLSIYLVGFQLPLSGVVLALPAYLVWIFRPFINAYWGWAGYFFCMTNSPLYDAYTYTNPNTHIMIPLVAAGALVVHAAVGAYAVWQGCRQRRWNA